MKLTMRNGLSYLQAETSEDLQVFLKLTAKKEDKPKRAYNKRRNHGGHRYKWTDEENRILLDIIKVRNPQRGQWKKAFCEAGRRLNRPDGGCWTQYQKLLQRGKVAPSTFTQPLPIVDNITA